MDLKNAAVLVTGGSCGIGLETARVLPNRGARVAICARHQDMVESAAKEIGALPIVADVSKEDDVARMISTVVKAYNDYNVLVNNAGFGSFAPLLELEKSLFAFGRPMCSERCSLRGNQRSTSSAAATEISSTSRRPRGSRDSQMERRTARDGGPQVCDRVDHLGDESKITTTERDPRSQNKTTN